MQIVSCGVENTGHKKYTVLLLLKHKDPSFEVRRNTGHLPPESGLPFAQWVPFALSCIASATSMEYFLNKWEGSVLNLDRNRPVGVCVYYLV